MTIETPKRRWTPFRLKGRRMEVFGRGWTLPRSRLGRIAIGASLMLGGCMAVLPVLGLWMLPLGLLVLSIDIAAVRRWRRHGEVRLGRRWQRRAAAKAASGAASPPGVSEAGPDAER